MCGAPLNPEATRAIISSGIYQPFPGPNCREIASPECDVTVQASVSSEGKIPFKGYETWYRVYGEAEAPGKLPLLCLHGGPGAAHDYLESLSAMANTGRRVIFYDQLGCSRSSIPESRPEMWTVDLYIEEVNAVRAALGLDHVHVLGQSWGGMLAMEYALTQPAGHGEPDRGQFAGQHDPVGAGGEPPA